MEAQDRSRSPSRRPSRVEQMVGRWLRRSRDLGSRSHSAGRDRSTTDGKTTQSSCSDQRSYAFRFNVQIQRDPGFISHGLTLSTQTPILVHDVTPGGPADGRLVPGDQLVKINNVSADDLTPEQAAEIIRECQDTLTMTVLRTMLGPKSSFITPEKKAKLRCNPVKVRFAEEVEVNGQSQGNSLLFLPNVLKVYLENGQTKAFKFEPSTTVKDIVMTLKEKLSLNRIENFSLVLEQQPGVTKLLLLHEEERIQQVVQKKEAHDYRCLFRVCFLPKNPQTLLEEDPSAFEYLYQQGVNDVLQERFAVEMKCNTALRLAALHIQERLTSCGYSSKTNLKTITKTWGIENFVSTTLLRNMKEKDLKKAISYHMKKCQSLQDPKQKITLVDQARINYLEELCELKSFGGKSFSATLMLQDRESTINLLVGARYGVSQVVNRKLSILTTLTDFNSITRVELLPESDRVSLVKIYVQDIKPITLLLETAAAKDMSCLIAGYCRVFIDPNVSVFPWTEDIKKHKISAEEGYVSRCGSDSDSSTDLDIINSVTSPRSRSSSESHGIKRKERAKRRKRDVKEKTDKHIEDKKDVDTEKDASEKHEEIKARKSRIDGGEEVRGTDEYPSEASDSCHTDSHAITSLSCDSLDALEEDDLLSCSTHHIDPSQTTVLLQILHPFTPGQTDPNLLAPPPTHSHPLLHPNTREVLSEKSVVGRDPQILTPPLSPSTSFQNPCNDDDNPMCFADLSRLADFLPSPPEASEEEDDEEDKLRKRRDKLLKEQLDSSLKEEKPISTSPASPPSNAEYVFNFDQKDARCYYNLVSNITPDSARSLPQPRGSEGGPDPDLRLDQVPILQPPPGFGDSSSDEEFFDARDRLTSPDHSSVATPRDISTVEMKPNFLCTLSPSDTQVSGTEPEKEADIKTGFRTGGERLSHLRKRSRKRRSFMETQYTSTVSFPEPDDECKKQHRRNLSIGYFDAQMLSADPEPSEQTQNPSLTLSSLTHSEGEPSQLETKPILSKQSSQESISQLRTLDKTRKQEMEMEPDSMESKSVTDLVKPPSPNIMVVRCRVDPDGKEREIADRTGDGKEELQEMKLRSVIDNGPFNSHMFLPDNIGDKIENAKICNGPLGASLFALEQNSYIEEYILQGVICNSKSFSPPPAPPSSPSVTVLCVSQNDCLENAKEIEASDSTKNCMPDVTEDAKSHSNPQTDGSVNEDEALVVASSTRTASEEVTDSTTSDNVFDDDEASISLNSSLSETKYELVVATRKSIIVDAVKVESQIGNSEAGSRLYSLSSDYSCALYSVTSKPGAASSDISPEIESKVTYENIKTTMNCTMPSLASPSLANPNNLDISNNPTSPSHFMFQSWSPSIMGRLSASTLRSKIQNLPFYLSRSQEAINQEGLVSPVQCPAIEYSEEKEITVDVSDIHNVTESFDLPIESVESDESDATVTGSDVEAGSEEHEKVGQNAEVVDIPLALTETEIEHQKQPVTFEMENSSPEPVMEPPTSIANHFQTSQNPHTDTPGPVTAAPQSKMRFGQPGEDIPGLKTSSSSIIQPQIVVTTQTLNGPVGTFLGEPRASIDRALMGFCRPAQPLSDSLENIAGGRRVSLTGAPLEVAPTSKSGTGCTSVLASECVSMVERVPLDTCGCFSEGDTFDEELTVYEFACRTQSSQVSGADIPIITAPPVHTFLTPSSTYSPSFPRSMLSSSASELSPLLSPLSDDCLQSQTHKEIVKRLGKEQYPDPPTGFQVLKTDVDQLLTILETTNTDQSVESQRGCHPRETCPAHFTENKRVLQIEARRLMTGCHRVVAVGQSEDEMFECLADSFRTLVGLAGLCLWFSSCDRCERRNAEAVLGLVDVTRSFRDFCVAAERASSKRSCQDLSTKLLAKQCTALTASVFCLTQLFRTLTAL